MKKIFLSIALVLFYLLIEAQPDTASREENKLTLKQCIETGLANNIDVLQSQLQMESDKITMNQSNLNLLPSLNGSASQSFSQGRSIDPYSNSPVTQGVSSSNYILNSGVTLFNGLSLQNTL
jgi:outer membrane protein